MTKALTLAERMKKARFATTQRRLETVSQRLMGDLVSALVGRTIHDTQWQRYETGESEPPLDVIRATAKISGLSESYIAFGTELPAPDPSQDRRLTDDGP